MIAAINRDLPDGYRLRLNDNDPPEPHWIAIEAEVPNGEVQQLAWAPDDRTLFDALRTAQGELIEHELGEAWPRCPTHGSHPLVPLSDGWHCPDDPDSRWDYGTLKNTPVAPEPDREDGEVRWWLEDEGWGVVAHHEGDLFVHFSAIEAEGYRALKEGERVEFRVSSGPQGRFQRADWVRQAPGR